MKALKRRFAVWERGWAAVVPETLKAIREHDPRLVELIERLDDVILNDRAIDKKTKRLIVLACIRSAGSRSL